MENLNKKLNLYLLNWKEKLMLRLRFSFYEDIYLCNLDVFLIIYLFISYFCSFLFRPNECVSRFYNLFTKLEISKE